MSSLPISKMTVGDYLALDRAAEYKSEFHDGELYPISAVSFEHSTIAANATRRIAEKLDGTPCRVLVQPLRVRVTSAKFVYPDLMVVCGRPEFTDEVQDTVTNPRVVIEVLSPSTADYDYATKFQLYRNLPSFTEYLLVEQNTPKVEVFRHFEGTDWLLSTYAGLNEVVPVKCLNISIPLAELYAGVEFVEPEAHN